MGLSRHVRGGTLGANRDPPLFYFSTLLITISLDKNITSYSIREGRYNLREASQRSEGLNTVPLKFEQETISMNFWEQFILGFVITLLHQLKLDPSRIPVLASILKVIYDSIGELMGWPLSPSALPTQPPAPPTTTPTHV